MRNFILMALVLVALALPMSLVSADGVAPDVDGDGFVSISDVLLTVAWFGSTDPPKSGGVGGAADTYSVEGTVAEFDAEIGWFSFALCDLGDAVTGGGYVALVTLTASLPLVFNEPGQELDHGWFVVADTADILAVANCIDNAPAHEALTASGSSAQDIPAVDKLKERVGQNRVR